MFTHPRPIKHFLSFILGMILLATACGGNPTVAPVEPPSLPAPTQAPTLAPTEAKALPKITAVELDQPKVPKYESIEMTLAVEAEYTNPFDAREVRLDGLFTGPDGAEMKVPGFWDGEKSWRVRFTPSRAGEWRYQLTISDERGASDPVEGAFNVTASDLHGWLQVGQWVNPEYSPRYLVYHDGTPFYGVGHCDALNILIDGFDIERGVNLFDNMRAAGENFVVWWPLYSISPIKSDYDRYSAANMKTIDLVVADAQKKSVFLIFTIWDHPQLRTQGHPWGDGNWDNSNGFRKLGDIDSFFTSDEAWAWQENFYRYIIARWGYSPAIGMWQTVSEINGTNAYDQTDPWHTKVNDYFVKNDPYRHPTTASKSGDVEWPEGHQAMDAPQVHIYDFDEDPVGAAQTLAHWTRLMWEVAEKPNWVGEFGVTGNTYYPELFHNSIWAALASGAAMTPAEWNSGGSWGRLTDEMNADLNRLGQFVAEIPLAKLNPSLLQISASDPLVRGWGVAGHDGGLFWVQDFALEGKSITEVRNDRTVRQGVLVELQGMESGTYLIHPYETWQGTFLESFEVECADGQPCAISLPDFKADMAFRIERK
ncbi:MAG TPA: DUF5060 domain-containing protein [Anaerolineales bacterium]|nr:DUF5060 domain-containing protein [Anaerolineales bacterium]